MNLTQTSRNKLLLHLVTKALMRMNLKKTMTLTRVFTMRTILKVTQRLRNAESLLKIHIVMSLNLMKLSYLET